LQMTSASKLYNTIVSTILVVGMTQEQSVCSLQMTSASELYNTIVSTTISSFLYNSLQ